MREKEGVVASNQCPPQNLTPTLTHPTHRTHPKHNTPAHTHPTSPYCISLSMCQTLAMSASRRR